MTSEASAILPLLLAQNEALQERVVNLEKSRSGSIISAHTELEGTSDTVKMLQIAVDLAGQRLRNQF